MNLFRVLHGNKKPFRALKEEKMDIDTNVKNAQTDKPATKRRNSTPANPDYAKKTSPKVQNLHLMKKNGLNIWEMSVLTGLCADDISKMQTKGWV